MKTSPTQFDVMVTFMEQHGDLSKPSTNPRGRIHSIERWEQLTSLLNHDPTGESKITEKWKKVWSDLKNNVKRKAARINRETSGTGCRALTNLEHRVLTIMGVQVARGLTDIEENGLKQQTATKKELVPPSTPPMIIPSPLPDAIACNISIEVGDEQWDMTAPSSLPHVTSPATPPNRQPSESGHTPRRRSSRGLRRRVSSTRVRESNSEWRKLQQLHHENEQKRLQLIELQLQLQRDWQQTADRALDMLDKVVNKFCKD